MHRWSRRQKGGPYRAQSHGPSQIRGKTAHFDRRGWNSHLCDHDRSQRSRYAHGRSNSRSGRAARAAGTAPAAPPVLGQGYDYRSCEQAVRTRRIIPHIRRRGEPPLLGCVSGKPRRWVVERTQSWIHRCRALLVRRERIGDHYEALLHLGCALIVCQQGSRS
jgi:hypothetical protein